MKMYYVNVSIGPFASMEAADIGEQLAYEVVKKHLTKADRPLGLYALTTDIDTYEVSDDPEDSS